MLAPISRLTLRQKESLLDDLNYLNMSEIKAFCKKRAIPYRIWIEVPDGGRRQSAEDDRKGVILNRVRHYLLTGEILDATCFPASVVTQKAAPKVLTATDRLYYGHYQKQGPMLDLMRRLTGARFREGAIARILARQFWSDGTAPTYQEFAAAWLQAVAEHNKPNPEWAFLSDRADGMDTANWKQLRNQKARQVLEVLYEL